MKAYIKYILLISLALSLAVIIAFLRQHLRLNQLPPGEFLGELLELKPQYFLVKKDTGELYKIKIRPETKFFGFSTLETGKENFEKAQKPIPVAVFGTNIDGVFQPKTIGLNRDVIESEAEKILGRVVETPGDQIVVKDSNGQKMKLLINSDYYPGGVRTYIASSPTHPSESIHLGDLLAARVARLNSEEVIALEISDQNLSKKNWKTYANIKFGLSFQYPPTATVCDTQLHPEEADTKLDLVIRFDGTCRENYDFLTEPAPALRVSIQKPEEGSYIEGSYNPEDIFYKNNGYKSRALNPNFSYFNLAGIQFYGGRYKKNTRGDLGYSAIYPKNGHTIFLDDFSYGDHRLITDAILLSLNFNSK